MSDASLAALHELIKRTALNAVRASAPAGICFGTVTSAAPLTIAVDQKMTLTEDFLTLSSLVRDFDVDMTVDHTTETRSGGSGDAAFSSHDHGYAGKKTFRVHLGLQAGEKVVMLMEQGGQRYVVLDRVR
ncbi:MAG: DUF2577 domain-containing protein [Oscillospiraceae bacterium]|nr:DUF2577 domain-containing protein [Oscillospiraceae bacterium]